MRARACARRRGAAADPARLRCVQSGAGVHARRAGPSRLSRANFFSLYSVQARRATPHFQASCLDCARPYQVCEDQMRRLLVCGVFDVALPLGTFLKPRSDP
eukprot:5817172-Pleurochrysis_carterae.AAC.1